MRGLSAVVQRLQREDLEEDRAERVDVGARVDAIALAADLLGRHVPRRADHRAVCGAARQSRDGRLEAWPRSRSTLAGGLRTSSSRRRRSLREPPVEHVDLAEVAEHDVRRLEIAVEHAARVRERDREADAARTRRAACALRTDASSSARSRRGSPPRASCPRTRFIVKKAAPCSSTPRS